MSASFKTILIIGGTSGIGEAFAKRFHNQGKKVIVTGRREARLAELKSAATGLETYTMDNTDLSGISHHVDTLFTKYPQIDTVWVNGGIQTTSSLKDISTSTDDSIVKEVTTNVTAPYIFARHIIPRLLARGSESTFMITSSGLAYVPVPLFPVYNSTKAAIHSYLVALRQQLKGTDINVIEIVPPYTSTEIDVGYRHVLGGLKPMPLADFTNEIFGVLDGNEAKDLKEIAAGSAVGRVDAWRSSIGEMLVSTGLGG
jgi:uncharacterized oxidoreductase